MSKVSIIVPVYKVEKYIERCIESLIHQTLQDIDIILVNDGSPDKSGAICDMYASNDSRIQVLHKPNEGQGIARDHGLQMAKGKYVCFLDSDDYLELNTCEDLYNQMEDTQADMCSYGYQFDDPKGNVVRIPKLRDDCYEGERFLKNFVPHYFGDDPTDDNLRGISACMTMFRMDIIKNNNIHFPSERKVLSEDTIFSLEYCKYAKKAITTSKVYYHYCQNEASFSQGYMPGRMERTQNLHAILIQYAKELNLEKETYIRLPMLIWVSLMATLKQETRRISEIGAKQTYHNIKTICQMPFLKDELSKLKGQQLPKQQKLLLFFILHQMTFCTYLLSYIRAKIKI